MANKQQREAYRINKELTEAEEKAAKFFKAQWEKMYYFLECEKIMPAYAELVQAKYPKQEEVRTDGFSHIEGTEIPEPTLTTASATI